MRLCLLALHPKPTRGPPALNAKPQTLLGGSWVVIRVPLRVPLKGSIGILERYRVSGLLGGSGVVISGIRSPLIWVITMVTLLITLLITTPEPPSTPDPGEGRDVGKSIRECQLLLSHPEPLRLGLRV